MTNEDQFREDLEALYRKRYEDQLKTRTETNTYKGFEYQTVTSGTLRFSALKYEVVTETYYVFEHLGRTHKSKNAFHIETIIDIYAHPHCVTDRSVWSNDCAGNYMEVSPYFIEYDTVVGISKDGDDSVVEWDAWCEHESHAKKAFEVQKLLADITNCDYAIEIAGEFVSGLDKLIQELVKIRGQIDE